MDTAEPLGSVSVLLAPTRSRIVLAGEVDVAIQGELGEACDEVIRRSVPVDLDVRHVTFMDSSAVALIARLAYRMGTPPRLIQPPDVVTFLLDVTKIGDVVEVVEVDPGLDGEPAVDVARADGGPVVAVARAEGLVTVAPSDGVLTEAPGDGDGSLAPGDAIGGTDGDGSIVIEVPVDGAVGSSDAGVDGPPVRYEDLDLAASGSAATPAEPGPTVPVVDPGLRSV
ncbi:STAS domain-containing protein [Georgenia sp. TF02-10]|uniref:STAS domain-containing protein n=1 Tax=Georgenia sp. TF02-10 TaxID=2917725 RepID=UPI001FA817D8|nr:STAS domain-containing protein [Georgenia sp. TF02-10]UNX55276.1 STAS domain-containing protein [Georgenia sp. TF02-10]